jgi:hypothetical protein
MASACSARALSIRSIVSSGWVRTVVVLCSAAVGAGPDSSSVPHAVLARLRGTAAVEHWTRAAADWDGAQRPHDAAYCQWRGAQVAMAQGQGTIAARLLRRAALNAREHVPLSAAIAATSRAG